MAQNFLYWLAIEESKPLRFSDLAHLMAKAMHPDDDVGYGASRLNLDADLRKAVSNGELAVRNPSGLGLHTFPHGAALQGAVMLPHDLGPFLESRGIELRLIPHGSGPNYWTIENAAIAIAEQEGWHDGSRGTLLDQMVDAANTYELAVRDPHTGLLKKSGKVRQFYELVTPAEVNVWLKCRGADYQWSPHPSEELDDSTQTLVVQIVGRPALPVRAIPFATGWRISPDDVVKQLARKTGEPFARLKSTVAFHLHGAKPKKMAAKEWDLYVARFEALEAELRAKYPEEAEGRDHRGYGEWRERSAAYLPAGVFVWLDDFERDFNKDFSKNAITFTSERDGERELNLSPFLEPEMRAMALAGFAAAPPKALSTPNQSHQQAAVTPVQGGIAGENPGWTLNEPRRYQGYSRALYLVLKAALATGGARPKPRDVLEAFTRNTPSEVIQVTHDGFTYYDSKGNAKAVDLAAVGEAIRRMTT